MNPLSREDVPSLKPEIVRFDDMNDTISWLDDMADGAYADDLQRIDADKLETLGEAAKLVRAEKLANFVRSCGTLCVENTIDTGSILYGEVREYAIIDKTDPEAEEQIDTVIRRFAFNIGSFEALYGRKPAVKKTREQRTMRLERQAIVEFLPQGAEPAGKELLKSMQESGARLSSPAEAFLRFTLRNQGFRMEELRKNKNFQKVCGMDFERIIRSGAGTLKEEISSALSAEFPDLAWFSAGKARGTRYFLIRSEPQTMDTSSGIMPSQPAAKLVWRRLHEFEVKPAVPEPVELLENRDEVLDAAFAMRLLRYIRNELSSSWAGTDFASEISKRVQAASGDAITRDQARVALQNYLRSGDLYRAGSEEGKVKVSLFPDNSPERKMEATSKQKSLAEGQELDIRDLVMVKRTLDAVASTGHPEKGKKMRTICLELSESDDEGRALISRIVRKGVLSRKLTSKSELEVIFTDIETFKKYKRDPESILELLFSKQKDEA